MASLRGAVFQFMLDWLPPMVLGETADDSLAAALAALAALMPAFWLCSGLCSSQQGSKGGTKQPSMTLCCARLWMEVSRSVSAASWICCTRCSISRPAGQQLDMVQPLYMQTEADLVDGVLIRRTQKRAQRSSGADSSISKAQITPTVCS